MAEAEQRRVLNGLNPVHAVLLASAFPLFLGALLSDLAYAQTYQIQWTNFASWLVAGGLLFSVLALVWASIDLLRADIADRRSALLYWILLLATVLLAFGNSLVHAKDAWAAMPAGMILSAIVLVLILVAMWVAFSSVRGRSVA